MTMEKMERGRGKLAMAILASKPKDEYDEESEMSEKEIAAEELMDALSTGTPKDVAEAFQSLCTLCM